MILGWNGSLSEVGAEDGEPVGSTRLRAVALRDVMRLLSYIVCLRDPADHGQVVSHDQFAFMSGFLYFR